MSDKNKYQTETETREELEKLTKKELIEKILEKECRKIKELEVKRLDSAQKVFESLRYKKMDMERENFFLIMLDNELKKIKIKNMFQGSESQISEVFPKVLFREIFRSRRACSKIIVAHNHPSGNPEPSRADISFTKSLHKACNDLDIQLLDHVIFTRRASYVSMKEQDYF